jgi:hypothetical protein
VAASSQLWACFTFLHQGHRLGAKIRFKERSSRHPKAASDFCAFFSLCWSSQPFWSFQAKAENNHKLEEWMIEQSTGNPGLSVLPEGVYQHWTHRAIALMIGISKGQLCFRFQYAKGNCPSDSDICILQAINLPSHQPPITTTHKHKSSLHSEHDSSRAVHYTIFACTQQLKTSQFLSTQYKTNINYCTRKTHTPMQPTTPNMQPTHPFHRPIIPGL